MNIILGVTGGVAAYKAADIARRLMEYGISVRVMMTANAEKFITPLTFEALTGNPVIRAAMPQPGDEPMPHIRAPKESSLILVAPATANIIGKMANGIADDMLSTTLIATDVPIFMAPAMNTKMFLNPAVQSNMERLRARGVGFIGPESGLLACGDEGEGKMSPVDEIVEAATKALGIKRDMAGLNVVVTAGGTREPIDAVRFVGNRSSGKMGAAIAAEAVKRGAHVTFISAAMEVSAPEGVDVVRVETAEQMLEAVKTAFEKAHILVMAAAVGDYKVRDLAEGKVKTKASWDVTLTPNPDIIAAMGKLKEGRMTVGFAAETERAVEYGREKLMAKNMDMIVVNDVSRRDIGFGSDSNEVTIITRSGAAVKIAKDRKERVARKILDEVMTVRTDMAKAG